jgi:F-type H+-transporting ATPase subunit delta|tara:strand:+ start:486 stop:1019 length:534 start_codon:yes stop_codon:yes gene_type:complete
MAQNLKVAQPYANAFVEMSSGKDVISDLVCIKTALESKELKQALCNPLIAVENKKKMVKSVFQGKIDNKSVNFLLVLCDRGRIDCLEAVSSLALEMAYKRAAIGVAYVTSACEMSESQQEALVGKLKSMTKAKEIRLETTVDKTLVGGFTVQVGSRIIDTSISGQLKKLASHLGTSE